MTGAARPAGAVDVAQRAAREVRAALRPFTIPNGITLLRLILTPALILAVLEGEDRLALGIFVAAGLSDALDGLLARALGIRSLLGMFLDPIADKLLLVSSFIVLTLPAAERVAIPVWLTVLVISRDVLIVLVALVLYLAAGIRAFPPSPVGKLTTFVQVLTVGGVLVLNAANLDRSWVIVALFYLTAALTVASGLDYVRRAAAMEEVTGAHRSGRGGSG